MIALLVVALFATPSPPLARVHFAHGQELFARGSYKEALDEFSLANEASSHELPELYFNIAQCHRNLGQPRQAAAALERYLALRPDAEDRRQVRTLIAHLRAPAATANEPPPRVDEPPPVETAEPVTATTPPPAAAPVAAPVTERGERSERKRGNAEPVATPTALPVLVAAPPPPPPRAHRKRLWLWLGLGAAAVGAGLAVGLGVGLGTTHGGLPMLGSAATFDTRKP